MIPPDYATFFTVMASVGATLFGLIFVAISIAPESLTAQSAPLERQMKATTAYIALLNPLIVSLFALVPHQEIGIVVLAAGGFGFLSTLVMTLTLLQTPGERAERIRHSLFLLASFILYGYETYFGFNILHSPADILWFYGLADLLIMLSAFGIFRAWDLIGIRQFHLRNWLASLTSKKKK